ncbi:LamG-like jellyroll fold domain-containing protein [Pedobacter faecalis]|uniref:LamG-like jellyroll fold domain-containing protein n=1 Tax=Pedobacter faecalis TaxID=3041495 RepID=UPI00254CC7EF|nr:LamG-like jellyroll fold domain-containing protein [Pedobacter sp. ELA7]
MCRIKLFALLWLLPSLLSAQSWMAGYEFRKKITFDKTRFEGEFKNTSSGQTYYDISDLVMLLEIEDDVLKYQVPAVCEGAVYDLQGRNIAFATAEAPAAKLNFQIESYDHLTGKYRFWVRVPSLSAAKSPTPPTSVYLYYSGKDLHESRSEDGLNTWNYTYDGVWHMDGERHDFGSRDQKSVSAHRDLSGEGFSLSDVVEGKVGRATRFNGTNQFLQTQGNTSSSFTFMAWIKWEGGNDVQVIAGNDSLARMGWKLQINPDGRLELITYRTASQVFSRMSTQILSPGVWTHIACYYSVTGTNSSSAGIYINGSTSGSVSSTALRMTASGGSLYVGKGKSGGFYFKGLVDEVRLFNTALPGYMIRNSYIAQGQHQSNFYIGKEERDPTWITFTGVVSTDWNISGNWVDNKRPDSQSKICISAGSLARINAPAVLGRLRLDSGARISVGADLQLNCSVRLGLDAAIEVDDDRKLTLSGEGSRLEGPGTFRASGLVVNAAYPDAEIRLESEVYVSGKLELSRGVLNANGYLTLVAGPDGAARLGPVAVPEQAVIRGNVHVQQYIDGSFPSPSSGRGWRLLSSPVYHNSNMTYGFEVLKDAVFITGLGGQSNGFDPSPNNGATIYTHDQSLPGTLAQKYKPITGMSTQLPLGRGFYLYSRGSRLTPNAYEKQIAAAPFMNPEPYILTYTGQLFTGSLTVPCFRSGAAGDGDGFNLVGNPYASPVTWGALTKVNLQDAVWLFDPQNNAYYVTNDPQARIPAGTGFFVRVKEGFSSGSLGFTESSKEESAPKLNQSLTITLRRASFSQPLHLNIVDRLNQLSQSNNALKVGEGFVSLASKRAGKRFSVDELVSEADSADNIHLEVYGFETGNYELHFKTGELPGGRMLELHDHYKKTATVLKASDSIVTFDIDLQKPESFGGDRFTLRMRRSTPVSGNKAVAQYFVAYPNPAKEMLHVKVRMALQNATARLSDLLGNTVVSQSLGALGADSEFVLYIGGLQKGIYLLQLFDRGKRIGKAAKIIKE